jgi:alkylation response protein AidB-like acyl-CoA dehydrogenase
VLELTAEQQHSQASFKAFTDREIVPHADRFDLEQRFPLDLIEKLARQGYLGSMAPSQYNGVDMDMITYGLLNGEIGRACSSARSLLTVHCMVCQAINRWGSQSQKEKWLSRLACGDVIASLALTEPEVGSDAASVQTSAESRGDSYVLNGRKKWISFGQLAGLFLILAKCDDGPTAFLVERDTPGLSIIPISGALGARASMLAEVHIDSCRLKADSVLGRKGFGLSHVFSLALDLGRYSVAWGCVGIGQACLDACLRYTNERVQFGAYLKDHQLISQMMTRMIVGVKAARLLCLQAGHLKIIGSPNSIIETSIAKYFASTMAMKVASDAVQIHGANGCGGAYSVQRYFRDAKVMEIIEGSTQIQELMIAGQGYHDFTI